jgi:hypothetical protein
MFSEILSISQERRFTDAYMAQHARGGSSQQIQSVAVHLITLTAAFEKWQPESKASEITRQAVETGRDGSFIKLGEAHQLAGNP